MSIPNVFTSGTKAKASEVNANFEHVYQSSPYYAPIGSVMAWLKTMTNTPALPSGWVECNGETLNDTDSPYHNDVLPDLNGDNRFLRGNSTSGGVGGSDEITHNHSWSHTSGARTGTTGALAVVRDDLSISNNTSDNKPPYMNVVWIMRVK